MTVFVATVLGAAATFVLTFFLVPITVGIILVPMMALLRVLAGRYIAYFLGRYGAFGLGNYGAGLLVYWTTQKFPLVPWILWIVFAYCVLSGFRTLFDFDVMCFRSQSGIFAPARE